MTTVKNSTDVSYDKINLIKYMKMALDCSSYSKCLRRQVGAVILCKSGRTFKSSNYPVVNPDTCMEQGCIRNSKNIESGTMLEECRCLHSEIDLIVQCALNGESPKDSIIFCSHSPCSTCARVLIRAQISILVYHEMYPDKIAIEILQEAGIMTYKL